GRYNFWLAGTPPGPSTSPIQWRINQEPAQEVADPTPRGPLYLNDRFGWLLLGTANLKKGERQRLTIYVTDRAASPPTTPFRLTPSLARRATLFPTGGCVRCRWIPRPFARRCGISACIDSAGPLTYAHVLRFRLRPRPAPRWHYKRSRRVGIEPRSQGGSEIVHIHGAM